MTRGRCIDCGGLVLEGAGELRPRLLLKKEVCWEMRWRGRKRLCRGRLVWYSR